MSESSSTSRTASWTLLLVSALAAVVCLILITVLPGLLVIFFAVLFVLSMVSLILESIGVKKHGDEWVDWRGEPVYPIDGLRDEAGREPRFRDVADPENFPRRLSTAWKRRVPLKKRNRFFSDRRFPNE